MVEATALWRFSARWPTQSRWTNEAVAGLVGQVVEVDGVGKGSVFSAQRDERPEFAIAGTALWLVIDGPAE